MVIGAHDFIAGMVREILEKDPRIEVAATPVDGPEAVGRYRGGGSEVVVFDIGGNPAEALTSISRLLRFDGEAQVIMVSTLNFTNVKAGIEGMEKGAAEFLQTPAAHTKDSSIAVFRHNLVETVHGLGLAHRRAARPAKAPAAVPTPSFELRRGSMLLPEALVVGSSTGGPQALTALFQNLAPSLNMPVFVAQHMPPAFTASLAKSITNKTDWPMAEGKDGEAVEKGHAYIAPGDKHMVLEKKDGKVLIRINEDPPVNFCRPSADPLFRSAAEIYGAKTMAAVLTGMGSDGEKGAGAIAEAGGTIVAQDEKTSIVWGMPRAVALAGVCSAVLPLEKIAGYLNKLAGIKGGGE
jgi:two-component system chemotaxis response regulator CheB